MKEFSTLQSLQDFFGREMAIESGEKTGWRMKAKLAVRGHVDNPVIGLFRPRSHDVMDGTDCSDHHPSINAAARLLRQEMIRLGTIPYDEKKHAGQLRYAQFFVCRRTKRVQLTLVALQKEGAEHLADALWQAGSMWHSIWINVQPLATNRILGDVWHLRHGEPFLHQAIGKAEIAFHPGAFAQANLDLFDRILIQIEEWVNPGAHLLEVYSGAGAISLHLAQKIQRAVLVEDNPYSYESFLQSAITPAIRFIRADARQAVQYLDEATCVIVDPPRKGLEPALLEELKKAEGKDLIYISCSFDSFQNDAKQLLESGWIVEDVKLYELFPQTDHVEIASKWKK
ncbi:MAG: rumA [Parachlamydiales bacterium]|nr:rumA [Parachlamydiales bacterium]